MKSATRFITISVGGLLVLMMAGMIIGVALDVEPRTIKEFDLVQDWLLYRLGLYVALIIGWPSLCRYVTWRIDLEGMTDDEIEERNKKRERDIKYLSSKWWKIAVLLVFFEVVIIQQFGL